MAFITVSSVPALLLTNTTVHRLCMPGGIPLATCTLPIRRVLLVYLLTYSPLLTVRLLMRLLLRTPSADEMLAARVQRACSHSAVK